MLKALNEEIRLTNEILNCYQRCLLQFNEERPTKDLLIALMHCRRQQQTLLIEALELFEKKKESYSTGQNDDLLSRYTSLCLSSLKKRLKENDLNLKQFLELLISIENNHSSKVFDHFLAANMKQVSEISKDYYRCKYYRWRAKYCLKKIPEGLAILKKQKRLSNIWRDSVLLVDDDNITLRILKNMLRDRFEIVVATNGQEAIEKIELRYYDLIISDICMPVMDGIELLKRCLSKYPTINKRFYLATGNPNYQNDEFLKKKNIPVMLKPLSIRDIQKISATL